MAANRHTFIIRIWQSEDGTLQGQISDPQDGWRRPFRDAAELWRLLSEDANSSPPSESSHARLPNPTESEQEEQP